MGLYTVIKPDEAQNLHHTHSFIEQWNKDLVAGEWIATINGTGTTGAVGTGTSSLPGGVLLLDSATTTPADDDETYVHRNVHEFQFADNTALDLECRLGADQLATNEDNLIVGVIDNMVDPDLLLLDGAGVAAATKGAWFEKRDGENNWRGTVSNGARQSVVSTVSPVLSKGAGTYQTLKMRIEAKPGESEVSFWVDPSGMGAGFQTRRDGSSPREPAIRLTFDHTGMTEAYTVVVGSKTGHTAGMILRIDYVMCHQRRL